MRLIRMMAVWNEVDVIQRNLDWYEAAGILTVAVDNGSTDGSYEVLTAAHRSGTVAALKRVETERFEWRTMLATLFDLVRNQQPDAVLLASPDEFFEVADGTDLQVAIEEDFAADYNVLEFANMEFQMTHRDDQSDSDPLTRMRYYTYRPLSMPRAYLFVPAMDIAAGYGHRVDFPTGVATNTSPRGYVSRHYPLRTEAQAREKIARILRRNPFEPPARRYLPIWLDPTNLYAKKGHLSRYRDDHEWVYEDREMPARLKATERALATLFLASLDLSASRQVDRGTTPAHSASAIEDLEHHVRLVNERQRRARSGAASPETDVGYLA